MSGVKLRSFWQCRWDRKMVRVWTRYSDRMRESPYHESDLKIEEHYTGSAGFTDHVFALCHLLGFRFAPRIRDQADRRIYVPEKGNTYPALQSLVGGTLNVQLIATQWKEALRLS